MNRKEFWTVIWTDEAREDFGIDADDIGIIVMDHDDSKLEFNASEKKRGRPVMRKVDFFPLFESAKEAEAYRACNSDWEVVMCQVNLYTND